MGSLLDLRRLNLAGCNAEHLNAITAERLEKKAKVDIQGTCHVTVVESRGRLMVAINADDGDLDVNSLGERYAIYGSRLFPRPTEEDSTCWDVNLSLTRPHDLNFDAAIYGTFVYDVPTQNHKDLLNKQESGIELDCIETDIMHERYRDVLARLDRSLRLCDPQQKQTNTFPKYPPTRKTDADPTQRSAIETAITTPISAIQGPPATGKTKVLSDIIQELLHLAPSERILVTSVNHVAVDKLEQQLIDASINDDTLQGLTRFYSMKRVQDDWRHGRQADGQIGQTHIQARRDQLAASRIGFNTARYRKGLDELIGRSTKEKRLDANDWEAWRGDHDLLTRLVIRSTRVMFCTSSSIRSEGMIWKDKGTDPERFFEATTCIYDEAGSAKHVDIMQPLVTMRATLRRVVFCGDDKQLGPTIFSEEAQRIWNRTWFTEAIEQGLFPITTLNLQYRSHNELYGPTDNVFYFRQMQSVCLTATPREFLHKVLLNVPMKFSKGPRQWSIDSWRAFVDVKATDCAQKGKRGSRSSWNNTEAEVISAMVQTFLRLPFVKSTNIGILTGYAQQATILRRIANRDNWSSIKDPSPQRTKANDDFVRTIDSSQGAEWDIVILSLVKNSSMGGAGFMGEPKRANVSTSRARECMYFVGEYDFWERMSEDSKSRIWITKVVREHKKAHEMDGGSDFVRRAMTVTPGTTRAETTAEPSKTKTIDAAKTIGTSETAKTSKPATTSSNDDVQQESHEHPSTSTASEDVRDASSTTVNVSSDLDVSASIENQQSPTISEAQRLMSQDIADAMRSLAKL